MDHLYAVQGCFAEAGEEEVTVRHNQSDVSHFQSRCHRWRERIARLDSIFISISRRQILCNSYYKHFSPHCGGSEEKIRNPLMLVNAHRQIGLTRDS